MATISLTQRWLGQRYNSARTNQSMQSTGSDSIDFQNPLAARRPFIALTCLLLIGCEPLWDAANRSSLEADVRALLKTASVVPQHLECHMVGFTRAASCTLSISPTEAASVIHTLALENIQPSSEAPSPLARLITHAAPSCVAGTSALLTTFGIAGHPNALKLPNGSAFEYLLLTINKTTSQKCVQVSYSYG